MKNFTINCPKCDHEFSPNESLHKHLDHLLAEERNKQQVEYAEKEEKLRKFQASLKQKQLEFEVTVQRKVEEKEALLKQELKSKLKEEYAHELQSLNTEIEEKNKIAQDAKSKIIELEKLKRDFADLQSDYELKYQQQLAEERKTLEETISTREAQKYELQLAEQRKRLDDTRKQLEEAKRKVEQGSMQLQGEVQEIALENIIKELFPFDEINEVPKGINGGDSIHCVKNESHKPCGTILYESKRTKNFQQGWISKLRQDQQRANAKAALLVTQTMPADVEGSYCVIDNVVICTYQIFPVVVALTRNKLIEVYYEEARHANKTDKMTLVYNYLTGQEFHMHLEEIGGNFMAMKDGIEKEKRAYERIWKEREKQLEIVIRNIAQMHGSLRAIAGNSVKELPLLTLND